jgi:trk system potassium uptake protein TrkH
MLLLMAIGGAPASTAGGIKTTTAAVLVLSVVAAVRGRSELTVGTRQIGSGTVAKAAAITAMMGLSIFGGTCALLLTQDQPALPLLFEVVSALGTVGVSLGATALLDDVGKVIVMGCMFAGRVGPITLFLLLLETRAERRWRLPTEEVPVG